MIEKCGGEYMSVEECFQLVDAAVKMIYELKGKLIEPKSFEK